MILPTLIHWASPQQPGNTLARYY